MKQTILDDPEAEEIVATDGTIYKQQINPEKPYFGVLVKSDNAWEFNQ